MTHTTRAWAVKYHNNFVVFNGFPILCKNKKRTKEWIGSWFDNPEMKPVPVIVTVKEVK